MLSSRHRASATAFASAVAFTLSFGPALASAQSREITAYVSALDTKGTALESLTPADVTVREDGLAREVLRVTPATEPLQVALLVDNSAASETVMADIRRALPGFLAALGDTSEVSLVTLGDRPTLSVKPTTSRALLQDGVNRLFPQSSAGAYVLEAVAEAARGFETRGATRPVVVVVATDGVEFSNRQADAVIDTLTTAGAALHVLLINQDPSGALATDEGRQRAILYDRGVSASGGQRVDLLTSQALERALTALADELTKQFKVVYSRPVTLIPPERVTIGAGRPGITVRGARAPVARAR